jgi:hypothetical protein
MQEYQGVIQGKEENPQIAGVTSGVDLPIIKVLKNWDAHRPIHEIQNKGYETVACTLFSGTDCVETLLNYHLSAGNIPLDTKNWLTRNEYIKDGSFNLSDRLPANYAEIVPLSGAYQYKANNAIAKYCIPDAMLPYTAVGEYKNPDPTAGGYYHRECITQAMLDLAKEFEKRITINWFYVEDKSRGLLTSPLQAIVRFANGDGVLRPEGRLNHAIMVYGEEDGGKVDLIDDSYTQQDKKYGSDFVFNYIGYKITFNDNSMDTKQFLTQNDLKWVRNETTGQFGRIMQQKLRPIISTDRGALVLLDDKVRGNKITVNGKEQSSSISNALWTTLPKSDF